MLDTQMLIGSKFVDGTEAPEAVINPKTEETIVKLPDASTAQVDAAVDAAAKAFKTWSRTTPAERSALLLKLADAIDGDAESFATLEALNCGKPRIRVLQDEMPGVVDCFRFFAGAVRNMHGAVAGEYMAGHTSMIRRDPIGVVGSIAPWNYPLMMAAWKLAPALAGGNTIVIKPSEQTPLTTLKLAKTIAEYRYRAKSAASRQPDHQAYPSRVGRQGASDRLRRCGPRCSSRRIEGFRLLQRGPRLHCSLSRLCRQEDLRQSRRRPLRRREGDKVQSRQRR
jgi:hypothetical protein